LHTELTRAMVGRGGGTGVGEGTGGQGPGAGAGAAAAPHGRGPAAPGARVQWARRALLCALVLAAPLSLHGDAVSLGGGARRAQGVGLRPCREGGMGADAAPAAGGLAPVRRAEGGLGAGGLGAAAAAAGSQPATMRLRGGKGSVKAGRSKSVQRSGSPLRSASVKKAPKKKRRPQKPYNLGPADWMNKVKRPELPRREISMKGMAKGRKKAVFHYWTKSKIKAWTEARVAFRAKRRERRAKGKEQLEGNNKAEVIHCWARGWKTKFVKWLPSIGEARLLEEAAEQEAAAAAKKKLEEKEAAGDGDEDEGEAGADGDEGAGDGETNAVDAAGGGEEEPEEDFMGGFGGGSDDSGLF